MPQIHKLRSSTLVPRGRSPAKQQQRDLWEIPPEPLLHLTLDVICAMDHCAVMQPKELHIRRSCFAR